MEQAFVFASDAQDNVLAAKEFHANATVELIPDRPFVGVEVTLTEVYIELDAARDQFILRATSYTQLPRGTSWPAQGYGKSGGISPVGKIDVTLRDDTQDAELATQYSMSSDVDWSYVWPGNPDDPTKTSIYLHVSPSILFVREQKVANRYYRLHNDVVAGQTLKIDEKDLERVMTGKELTLPASHTVGADQLVWTSDIKPI